MRSFDKTNFTKEVTEFIKDWTQLLSHDKFQEAIDLLDSPRNGTDDLHWTVENLKEAFLDYGEVGRMPEINNPHEMGLEGDFIEFYKYDNGSGWAVNYDFPLDGERGEITAKFSFKKVSENIYFIYLSDIRTM